MKKLLLIVTALFSCSLAEAYSTIYNPFTGKLDYVGISSASLPSGSTFYIQNTTSPQSATLNVTSGTITNFNATTINGVAPGDITAVTAGFGLSGGATVGAATLNWTNIGIASMTVTVSTIATLTSPSIDGVTTINGVAPGDITAVTAGYGMTGGAIIGAATLNWTNTSIASMTVTVSTITNLSVSSMTSTLPMSNRKITGLANGTVSTDAVTYGQVGVFSVLCSSVIALSSASAAGVFVPSNLGCSGALSDASHHVYLTANATFSNNTTGDQTQGAVFVDGANLDDSGQGQCAMNNFVAATTSIVPCFMQEYYAPGDTSSHAYRVYFGNSAGTQTMRANTSRMVVFEVQ